MGSESRQCGLTLIEALTVVAVVSALVLVTAPPMVEAYRNSQIRSAARDVSAQLQLARARAVSSGWQFRLVGVSDSGGALANRYRMMARDGAGTPWPALDSAAVESGTLLVGPWIDFSDAFPGVTINPGDSGSFALTFDERGAPVEMSLNFNPLRLANPNGAARTISVSSTGNVRVD